jgi:hypothetical protein
MPVEIILVHGRGLATVHSREVVSGMPVVRYVDHGHILGTDVPYRTAGYWAWERDTTALSPDEARAALRAEHAAAVGRGTPCSRRCWCARV